MPMWKELKGAELITPPSHFKRAWICMVTCFHARISPQVDFFPFKGRGGPEDASKANI